MKITSFVCGLAALFALGLSTAGATPITYTAGDTPVLIPDVSSGSSTITVAGSGRVLDLNVLLNITHSFDHDLVLTLSHDGTTVVLASRLGGVDHQNYNDTLFDDSASQSIDITFAPMDFAGTYSPEQALSAFNDMDIAGDWTLTAYDMEAGDSGVINNFSLQASVPEPASLALFGLGVLGLAGSRRRRK